MFQFPRGKKCGGFYGKARKWQYVAYACVHWHNLTLPASLENITSSQVVLLGSPCKDHCCQRWQRIKTEKIRLPEWLSGVELPCRPGELTWDRSVRKKEKSLSSLAIKFFLNLFWVSYHHFLLSFSYSPVLSKHIHQKFSEKRRWMSWDTECLKLFLKEWTWFIV